MIHTSGHSHSRERLLIRAFNYRVRDNLNCGFHNAGCNQSLSLMRVVTRRVLTVIHVHVPYSLSTLAHKILFIVLTNPEIKYVIHISLCAAVYCPLHEWQIWSEHMLQKHNLRGYPTMVRLVTNLHRWMCSVETQCVKTEPLNYIQHWKNETTCNPVMVSLCLWKSYA